MPSSVLKATGPCCSSFIKNNTIPRQKSSSTPTVAPLRIPPSVLREGEKKERINDRWCTDQIECKTYNRCSCLTQTHIKYKSIIVYLTLVCCVSISFNHILLALTIPLRVNNINQQQVAVMHHISSTCMCCSYANFQRWSSLQNTRSRGRGWIQVQLLQP